MSNELYVFIHWTNGKEWRTLRAHEIFPWPGTYKSIACEQLTIR